MGKADPLLPIISVLTGKLIWNNDYLCEIWEDIVYRYLIKEKKEDENNLFLDIVMTCDSIDL